MVLVTVLWILLVLSFISFALAAAVRVELNSTGNSFDSDRAILMAKGAAEAVLQKLRDPKTFPESPMREEQGAYIFKFDSGEVRVRTENRIDLNNANAKSWGEMSTPLDVTHRTGMGLAIPVLTGWI